MDPLSSSAKATSAVSHGRIPKFGADVMSSSLYFFGLEIPLIGGWDQGHIIMHARQGLIMLAGFRPMHLSRGRLVVVWTAKLSSGDSGSRCQSGARRPNPHVLGSSLQRGASTEHAALKGKWVDTVWQTVYSRLRVNPPSSRGSCLERILTYEKSSNQVTVVSEMDTLDSYSHGRGCCISVLVL